MSNTYEIYLVSDSTGETLERIFLAIKAQFKNFNYKTHYFSFTRTENQILKIIENSTRNKNSIFLYTIFSMTYRIFFDYLEALKNCDSKKEVNDIKMYAWDNELSRIKWWEEPPLSLAYYFKERAQQLRDKYSYIRLFVSGGYASY